MYGGLTFGDVERRPRHPQLFITATDMSCLMHLEGIARRQNHNLKAVHIAEILNSNRL